MILWNLADFQTIFACYRFKALYPFENENYANLRMIC